MMNMGGGWVSRALAVSAALLLTACERVPGNQDVAPATRAAAKDCDSLFVQRVQPRLEFCRTCHVPGGVADVDEGREFMLSADAAQDYELLHASWEALGRNDHGPSRILKMASGTDSRSHTGGKPWPVGSEAYREMDAQLLGFVNPQACALDGSNNPPTQERPLLGSQRGGHAWFEYCANQDDAAELPVDPRALIQPGVNQGRAVLYNAYWKDCHANPELVGEDAHPKTCGELRASHARGAQLMEGHGEIGAGNFFAGTEPDGYLAFPASVYNNLWLVWSLTGRPDNFDELVAQRFGAPLGTRRNPYPLPGEDANASNGGSGQLPTNMTQTRNRDGSWSGNIALTCHGCHSGHVGTAEEGEGLGALFGSGTGLPDVGVIARDLAAAGAPPMAIFGLFSASRGTNNAQFGNLTAVPDPSAGAAAPDLLLAWLTSGSTASMDTPAWWNMGHRPVKFIDGIMPADAVRVDMAFYTPLLDQKPVPTGQDTSAWVRAHNQAADHWVVSLKSPVYPLAIDEALAEQGAVLFHGKDLWAPSLSNPVPRPEGGNGSCASCHGAYAPRYVHDTAFLETPALEGVASYITPMDIIRTDPARLDAYNESVQQSNGGAFAGYPETVGTDQDCGAQTREDLRGDRALGYLAPPLFGVWATAPYLHNGAVPDLWTLLQPAERPKIWRRVSTPARADQAGQVVMGFDTSIARAYDAQRGGWKYEVLSCGEGTVPLLDCDPLAPETAPLSQQLLAQIFGNVVASWNVANASVFAQWTPQQIEERKIYNTHRYSQGNQGHDFTAVLTDAERRALIEYLKTL